MGESRVYISYAWGGESERVTDALDADLQAAGITVVRDKRDLGYKGRIRGFMEQIGLGHAVVVVISDKYLKSSNCMFELVEIARRGDVHDRIFPVVLADADIYDPVKRIAYIKHWESKRGELAEAMRSVDPANLQGLREEIDSYDAIRDHVSRLTFLLKDMNTLTPEMHEGGDFARLIAALKERLAGGASAAVPASPAPAAAVPAATAAAPAVATAYLQQLGEKLQAAGYKALKGERFGPLRFKAAWNLEAEAFIANDHYRVVVLDEPAPDPARLAAIEQQLQAYAKELNERNNGHNYIVGLVLVQTLSAAAKDWIYALEPPKLGWTEGSLATLVLHDAPENDLHYPTDLPDELDCKFAETIQQFLMPER